MTASVRKTRRGPSKEEALVRDLMRVKKEYERYFKGLDRPDNAAMGAYTGIIKTAADLIRKQKAEDGDISWEEKKRMAEEIFETEYGIKRDAEN